MSAEFCIYHGTEYMREVPRPHAVIPGDYECGRCEEMKAAGFRPDEEEEFEMTSEEIKKHKPLKNSEAIRLCKGLLLMQKLSNHERSILKRMLADFQRAKDLKEKV